MQERFVEVSGAVKEPGALPLGENMTVQDAILQAGGFVEGAFTESVEVTSMDFSGDAEQRAQTVQVPLAPGSPPLMNRLPNGGEALITPTYELDHRDRVYVRLDPRFRPQQTVTLRGEVAFRARTPCSVRTSA